MSGGRKSWSLAALAAEAGLPARTVRYYIALGLLPGPDRAGRGAAYGPDHRARIRAIRAAQAQGQTLAEIAHREAAGAPPPASVAWRHYAAGPDVMVMVREGAAPWRVRQVVKMIGELAAGEPVAPEQKEDDDEQR